MPGCIWQPVFRGRSGIGESWRFATAVVLSTELTPAYRAHVAATKAAKKKPGPGRGKRKSGVGAEADPEESMAVDEDEEEEEEHADGGEGADGDDAEETQEGLPESEQ